MNRFYLATVLKNLFLKEIQFSIDTRPAFNISDPSVMIAWDALSIVRITGYLTDFDTQLTNLGEDTLFSNIYPISTCDWGSLTLLLVQCQTMLENWVIQGIEGPQGIQGAQGIQGMTGSAGSNGTNGTNGTNGSDGADGATGPQGSQGIQGSTGATGSTGSQGTAGATGATGPLAARTTSALSLSLVGTGATGTQIHATKDSTVRLTVSTSTTATISGPSTSLVSLKICSTNNATEGSWTTVATVENDQTITLAVVLQSVQVFKGQMETDVPGGWYVKLVNSGTGTHSEGFVSGQQTIYG